MAMSVIFRVSAVGVGTYMIYKAFVPSEIAIERGITSAESDLPYKNKTSAFGRVMKLSSEGYSYEEITKIIGKEEKERYKELFEKEKQERLAYSEAQAKAKQQKIKVDEAIKTAVSFITGKS